MADRVDVRITGTINLKRELDEFKGSMQRRIIRPGLIAVGEYYKGIIQSNCNFIHGWSKDLIKNSVDYNRPSISVPRQEGKVVIGPTMAPPHGKSPTTSPGIYALWVEYGLKNPREGGQRGGEKQKHGLFGKQKGNFSVPNYPAQPFMRKSFEQGAQQAIEIFRNTVTEQINRRGKSNLSTLSGPLADFGTGE